MAFKVPEIYRATYPKDHYYYSDESYGNNGVFKVPLSKKKDMHIIASDGGGWDHVSVSCDKRVPTYYELQKIRRLFWDREDIVVAFHLSDKDNINIHEHCLHLWRKQEGMLELPPTIMV